MDDEQFREILQFYGRSWPGYRRVRRGVKKRLRAHMLALDVRHVKEYLERLALDREARRNGERLMDVSISRFFRDRDLWRALEEEVLPGLIRGGEDSIRVWSAGCACGEEAYSVKMVWQILSTRLDSMPALELWATDVNPVFLERAKAGIYTQSSLKEVPEELRSTFFEHLRRKNRFVLSSSLKEGIVWRRHNLSSDEPPSEGFHLIFLRNNLLTYHEMSFQVPAFRRILSALRPRGVLTIGKKERLPPDSGYLVPLTTCSFAYRKVRPGDLEGPDT